MSIFTYLLTYLLIYLLTYYLYLHLYLQCFDTVGWAGCQEEHLACKNWVMRCWCGCLSAARCSLFASGPADATAIPKRRHLLPHLNPDWFYLTGLITQVILEKRPLNGCSTSYGYIVMRRARVCVFRRWGTQTACLWPRRTQAVGPQRSTRQPRPVPHYWWTPTSLGQSVSPNHMWLIDWQVSDEHSVHEIQ